MAEPDQSKLLFLGQLVGVCIGAVSNDVRPILERNGDPGSGRRSLTIQRRMGSEKVVVDSPPGENNLGGVRRR